MPRLSANLGMLFTERPLLDRVAAAAACGFPAIEVQFPYDVPAADFCAALERHQLARVCINTRPGEAGESGVAALPGRERDFAAAFAQALDYAATCGFPFIHCMAGIVPPAQHAAAAHTFVANLREAADGAAPHGVTLLIEPINRRDRPDYFLAYAEQAADIIAEVARPNIRMMFDCYHQQIMGGDLIRRIERHLPLIGHVQIAGVPARGEPDRGEVHYPAIFEALDALGYRGHVGAEYKPSGHTEDSLGWGRPYGLRA